MDVVLMNNLKNLGLLSDAGVKGFANGSTTQPKTSREALGLKAGATARFVISEKGVHIEQDHSAPEGTDVDQQKNLAKSVTVE